MSRFHPMEWNSLVNRARANLQAQRTCSGPGPQCATCPMGRKGANRATPPSDIPCRARFRATERQLWRLVHHAPGSQRFQLRRTLDGLELAYREMWQNS